MQNHGDTLVANLRLGDQVWSHGVLLGTVIQLILDPNDNRLQGRAHVGLTVVCSECDRRGRYYYLFLASDRVHVGSSLVTSSAATA